MAADTASAAPASGDPPGPPIRKVLRMSQQLPATPRPLVSVPDMHCQLLYFTSTSLTSDGKAIVFIGDDGESHNLYAFDCATGAIRKLTSCRGGYLRSYVYFDGRPYEGFGKASVSLDADNGLAYFIEAGSSKWSISRAAPKPSRRCRRRDHRLHPRVR